MNNDNNTQKQITLAVVGMALLVVFCGFVISRSPQSQPSPKSGGGFITSTVDSNGNTGATTTVTTLSPTQSASTTLTFYSAGASSIDLNMQYTASTTAGCLQFQYSFSNNNSDWYYETGRNVSSNALETESPLALNHTWCPVSTATVRKNIGIFPVASKYTRVEMMPTGATSTIYVQAVLKQNLQN